MGVGVPFVGDFNLYQFGNLIRLVSNIPELVEENALVVLEGLPTALGALAQKLP